MEDWWQVLEETFGLLTLLPYALSSAMMGTAGGAEEIRYCDDDRVFTEIVGHLPVLRFYLDFQVLGVAAHPRERLILSSDGLGALHAWQYNPTT